MAAKILTRPYFPDYDGYGVMMEAVGYKVTPGQWGNKLRVDFQGCQDPIGDALLSRFYNFPDPLSPSCDVVKEFLIANLGELPDDGELDPEVFLDKVYDVELRSVEKDGVMPYTVVGKILKRRL